MSKVKMPIYRFEGTIEEIGLAHGETLREMIHEFAEGRFQAARQYFLDNNASHHSIEGFVELAAKCFDLLKIWDPEGYLEHMAIARGANFDPVKLYLVTGYTDLRDAYLLAGDKPDAEGCTAILVPKTRSAEGKVIAAQSWDLTPYDLDYVLAIHTKPKGQPEKWSISTAGCVCLMGMNRDGIAVGTTNIKTYGSKLGVSYINLLHKALRAKSRAAIGPILEGAPRSGAHTYWIADQDGAEEYEMTPNASVTYPMGDEVRIFTNHCMAPSHQAVEYQPPSASSLCRLNRMGALMAEAPITVERLMAAYQNREDGVHSINRYPEDKQGTATNACMITIPESRTLWTCRGPADRAEWVQLGF